MKKIIYIWLIATVAPVIAFAQSGGKLTVNFTTKTYTGTYAPKHILAVWIVNSSGTFVKTLMSYYSNSNYVQYLSNWKKATSTYDRTDAITGSTVSSHIARVCYWNGANSAGTLQADGTYTVWIEFTESNGTGKYTSFSFTKSGTSVTVTPTATSYITGISASWVPTSTATDLVGASTTTIFMNQQSATLYVLNCDNFERLEVYSVRGQLIKSTSNTSVSIPEAAPGYYMARILTADGEFTQKFRKK